MGCQALSHQSGYIGTKISSSTEECLSQNQRKILHQFDNYTKTSRVGISKQYFFDNCYSKTYKCVRFPSPLNKLGETAIILFLESPLKLSNILHQMVKTKYGRIHKFYRVNKVHSLNHQNVMTIFLGKHFILYLQSMQTG